MLPTCIKTGNLIKLQLHNLYKKRDAFFPGFAIIDAHLYRGVKLHLMKLSLDISGPRTAFKLFVWILLVFPLSTMSNPVPLQDQEAGPSSGHHHKSKRPHDRPAKWINPCRIPSALPAFQMDMDIEIITQSDSEIISNIITQVNKAELQSRRFMEQYVSHFTNYLI